jgi:hypothetical protein
MNLQRVREQAKALGIERMLLLGLLLASDLLDTTLPTDVAHTVQTDAVLQSLGWQVREWLFGDKDGPSHLLEEAAFYIRLQDRLRERTVYTAFYFWAYLRPAIMPTSEDQALLPLPSFLSFVHYLARPVRMLRRYGLQPLKRLVKSLPKCLLASG